VGNIGCCGLEAAAAAHSSGEMDDVEGFVIAEDAYRSQAAKCTAADAGGAGRARATTAYRTVPGMRVHGPVEKADQASQMLGEMGPGAGAVAREKWRSGRRRQRARD
jgi:hypothetical protein